MNGHDIQKVDEKLARCKRCGLPFRTAFILGKVQGTTQETAACNEEQRAAYAARMHCQKCAATLADMEHHAGYEWKVCPECSAAHRLISTFADRPGSSWVVDKVFLRAPWE